jgi:hypothetical protein
MFNAMRIFLISVVLLFGLSACYAQSDSLPISVTIKVDSAYVRTYSKKGKFIKELIRRNNYVVKSDSIKEHFFDISLTIKNTSDTTIAISLMTCSWPDNFIVNNNYIHFTGQDCDRNFPHPVEFEPGESKVFTTTLAKSMKFDYPCDGCTGFPEVETTKLGLIIIDDIFRRKPFVDYFVAMGDKSAWKIVWSNSLYLLTENEAHPKSLEFGIYQKGQN